jgi:hypothetical protein
MKGLSPRPLVASTSATVEKAPPVALMAPIQASRRMASGLEILRDVLVAAASPACAGPVPIVRLLRCPLTRPGALS